MSAAVGTQAVDGAVAAGRGRRTFPLVLVPILGSALAWAVLFLAVPPSRQNFPLNDDFAFSRGAFLFARGEGVHYGGWASMPQLGQWLWACPFVWLLGESHVVLRLSTLVLSWLGLWAFYDLLRQEGLRGGEAALAAATLAANPLFVLLQGTFMTDVPALSFSLAALALYGRGIRQARVTWLAAGCWVAVLAVATRQNTLAVPLAACLLLWRDKALRARPAWWLGVLLPAGVGVAVHWWFGTRSDVRALAPAVPDPDSLALFPYAAVHFLGLSALPLLLAGPRRWGVFAVAFLALLACAAAWVFLRHLLPYGGNEVPTGGFPYTENMLTPWGAFAGSRLSGRFIAGERPALLGPAGRLLLTLLGCVAGAALVERGFSRRPAGWQGPLPLFTAPQLAPFVVVKFFYDRYFLFLLPGALALASRGGAGGAGGAASPGRRGAAWALVALTGVASFGLMHDWLAWNAARWALGRRALVLNTDPLDIEGGVEWDGWYATPGSPVREGKVQFPRLFFTREWFPAVRGRFILSFSELPNTRLVDSEPYSLWLLPGPRRFYLLEQAPLPAQPGRGKGR